MSRSRVRLSRRGTAYLLVLIVSTIVVVMGVSGVLGQRLRRRAVATVPDTTAAQVLATSALDLALRTARDDPAWRTVHANDAWSAPVALDGGVMRYKFVDPDGNLANVPFGPVRVVGRGERVGAVQMCSVFVGKRSDNLLANADMEAGTSGWQALDGVVLTSSATARGGAASLLAEWRWETWSGPGQDITSELVPGAVFETEAWVMSVMKDDTIRIVIEVTNDTAVRTETALEVFAPADTWVRVSGVLAPAWTGTAVSATWRVDTVAKWWDFRVDDAGLVRIDAGTDPIAGTWRREVE